LFDTGWFKRTCELVPDRRERWEIVVGHWSRSAQLFPADTIRHATIVDTRNAAFVFFETFTRHQKKVQREGAQRRIFAFTRAKAFGILLASQSNPNGRE
jgi:hypothetical protein